MTSNRLFFNLVSADMKKKRWLLVIWSYVCLMQVLNYLITPTYYVGSDSFLGGPDSWAYFVSAIVMGVWMGVSSASFLFSKKKTDFYYSLPAGRKCLIGSVSLSSFLIYLIPMVISRVAGYIVVFIRNDLDLKEPVEDIWKGVLVGVLAYLLIYNLAMVSSILFGNVMMAVAGLAILLFYGEVVIKFVIIGYSNLYLNSFYYSEFMEKLQLMVSPVRLLDEGLRYTDGMILGNASSLWTFGVHFQWLVAALIWIVVSGILIYWLIERRRAEYSELPLAFPKIKLPFRMLMAVPGGLICGQLLQVLSGSQGGWGWAVTGILIGTITVYGVIGVVYQSALKGFLEGKAALLASIGIGLGIVGVFGLIGSAYDKNYPALSQVESMGVSIGGFDLTGGEDDEGVDSYSMRIRLDSMELTGKNLDNAYQWMEALAGNSDKEEDWTKVAVVFRLRNGQNTYRTYGIKDFSQLDSFLPVFQSAEYKEGVSQLPYKKDLDSKNVIWMNGLDTLCLDLSPEEKDTLYQCILEDSREVEIEALASTVPLGAICWSYMDAPAGARCFVYPDSSRTIAFLEEKGISPGAEFTDITVLSARKVFLKENGDIADIKGEIQPGRDFARDRLVLPEFNIYPILLNVDKSVEIDLRYRGRIGQTYQSVTYYQY